MLSEGHRQYLKSLAMQSIEYGLEQGKVIQVNLDDLPEELSVERASFVTLNKGAELRGCIGMLYATRPLAEDIADNSFAAAFRDHRFHPLVKQELAELSITISVLSPPELICCRSESELLEQLTPCADGLILREGSYQATFLPTVWQSLPNPTDFVQQLKNKAGLTADYWSPELQAYRYTTESF